ncbi:hypothetical protein [Pseudonocardia sp. ICBG1293]|uniref:hypothetical protein n=1 Tax=Pseudonocardia sp. ICBG1293 TaxID=2844382 RepID=UPI001CCDDC91|nr:hypothetical protein [Pseudonocardia sp. ICBG1293]
MTETSSSTTSSGSGMWWSSVSSASFARYSSSRAALSRSPGRGSCPTRRSGRPAPQDSSRKARAVSSRVTSVMRSSKARSVRDSNDTSPIPATKQAAIFTPSGRSTMFATVV